MRGSSRGESREAQLEGHGGQGGQWPPGWYPNPEGPGQRYWDGFAWTEHYYQPQGPLQPQQLPSGQWGRQPQAPSPQRQWQGPPPGPGQQEDRRRRWPLWAIAVLLVIILVAALSPGEDSSDKDDAGQTTEQQTERTDTAAEEARARAARAEAEQRRAAAARRERARRARVRRARAARRREQVARRAQLAEEQRLAEEEQARREREALQDGAGQDCHPAYDPCLDPNASDYDCENGSGDGPEYTGLVTVKGSSDPYDLDRDGDRIGCD